MAGYTDLDDEIPQELRKFLAPEFIFGVGALELAGGYAAHLGARHIMLITDPGLIDAGWCDRVSASLDDAGLSYTVYSDVTPNPRTEEVMAGAELYHSSQCDALLALGGGSPIDCAKGIGIVVANGRHIDEFEGADKVEISLPPLLCIPTTAGSAADVSQFAVLSRRNALRKITCISKALVPDLSLIDPDCLTTMDSYLTACTGLDALSHAMEAYVSTGHSPITDMHARESIRLIRKHLVKSIEDGDDMDARRGMALASLQAGLAFSNASLGAIHALSHVLGGRLDLAHGECNAQLLEQVAAFNFPYAPQRYRHIATLLGVEEEGRNDIEVSAALGDALRDLCQRAGFSNSLSSAGVRREDIPELARDALLDVCMATNPRLPTQSEVESIYERAL
jgi:alcohol dehydrogenase